MMKVNTKYFELLHGCKPAGMGTWIFTIAAGKELNLTEKYETAIKHATKFASKENANSIFLEA